MAKTALFTNFTDKEFIGYWDGKPKKFAPGQSLYMPDYLAKHFAKHLTNRELLRVDTQGNALHKNGEKMTSPKFPEQVPVFMELFNKAYIPDDTEESTEVKSELDMQIEVTNRNIENTKSSDKQDPTQPQVIIPPDFEDNDDEESFKGKPIDTESNVK